MLSVSLFQEHSREMVDLLKRLVTIESPSTEKEAVDRLVQMIGGELALLGAELQVIKQAQFGDQLVARWNSTLDQAGILLLCHMDTVFASGTLAQMPLLEKDGRLFGPGVYDMKAGIAIALTAIRVLRQEKQFPMRPVTLLLTSDEEVGSDVSQAFIETLARQAELVLCLEPALPDGSLKTARKGTGEMEIITYGKAAHAGGDHDKGRNAIEELAHHILAAQRLTDYAKGTTVNVGKIRGGTRTNVVPDEAHAWVDFRVMLPEETQRLADWAAAIQPVIPGTRLEVKFSVNRPPMPRDATMVATFLRAQQIAHRLGLQVGEGSTGGASDANFVAPLGVPVLDGLGAIGDGAHSEREYVEINSLPERAALLAGLLVGW